MLPGRFPKGLLGIALGQLGSARGLSVGYLHGKAALRRDGFHPFPNHLPRRGGRGNGLEAELLEEGFPEGVELVEVKDAGHTDAAAGRRRRARRPEKHTFPFLKEGGDFLNVL